MGGFCAFGPKDNAGSAEIGASDNAAKPFTKPFLIHFWLFCAIFGFFVRRMFHTQQKTKPIAPSSNSNSSKQLENLSSPENIRANGTEKSSVATRELGGIGFVGNTV